MKGFETLELDLPAALKAHLLQLLLKMEAAPLAEEFLKPIPGNKDAQGIYLLLLNGDVVYVGKTDGKSGLRRRLYRHWKRVQHRIGLDSDSVFFKAVRVYVFTPMNLEAQLRAHFKPAWDGSGFGSNDPGTQRESTKLKPGGFDASYPIDIDRRISLDLTGVATFADLLLSLRAAVPYTVRWETVGEEKVAHSDLMLPWSGAIGAADSARKVVTAIVGQLPSGWQATALAGRIILYKAHEDFDHGQLLARS